MKYMLLIQQGDAPTPYTPEECARLSEEEQNAVYMAYEEINETPGVSRGRLELDRYHYMHATRADLLRRLERIDDARAASERALELVHSEAEQRFLEQRLAELLA
jgi:predicted RNA polymerase sigma factor